MKLTNLEPSPKKIKLEAFFDAPTEPYFQVEKFNFLYAIKMMQLKEFGSFSAERGQIFRNIHETE